MKRSFVVCLGLVLGVTVPAVTWAAGSFRSGMAPRGPTGFVFRSPASRGLSSASPASPSLVVTSPVAGSHAVGVPESSTLSIPTANPRIARQPAQPKLITVGPSGAPAAAVGPKVIVVTAPSGQASGATPAIKSSSPSVTAVSRPVMAKPIRPKLLVVESSATAVAGGPKVIVISSSGVSASPRAKVLPVEPRLRRSPPLLLLEPAPEVIVGPLGPSQEADAALLVVEATPADAQVYLDGGLLGTAGQLLTQAVKVSAGPHAIEIVLPGFRPFSAEFSASPGLPTRLHVALGAE